MAAGSGRPIVAAMRGVAIVALILGTGSAVAAGSLPFSGVFGSPGACGVYEIGGKNAVLNGGRDKDGNELPVDIEEDDGFVLLEPTGLATEGLTCEVSKIEGTGITYGCSDGEPLLATVLIRGNDVIIFTTEDDEELVLRRCGPGPAAPAPF